MVPLQLIRTKTVGFFDISVVGALSTVSWLTFKRKTTASSDILEGHELQLCLRQQYKRQSNWYSNSATGDMNWNITKEALGPGIAALLVIVTDSKCRTCNTGGIK